MPGLVPPDRRRRTRDAGCRGGGSRCGAAGDAVPALSQGRAVALRRFGAARRAARSRHHPGRGALHYAVLEGWRWRCATTWKAMAATPGPIRLTGGGGASRIWPQLIGCHRPVGRMHRPARRHHAALGVIASPRRRWAGRRAGCGRAVHAPRPDRAERTERRFAASAAPPRRPGGALPRVSPGWAKKKGPPRRAALWITSRPITGMKSVAVRLTTPSR